MTPAFLSLKEKAADDLAKALTIVIPSELKDNLIGAKIPGTNYYEMKEGDPTKGICGYVLNESGKKIYKIEHQPTGSRIRYKKINSMIHGECWEPIQEERMSV